MSLIRTTTFGFGASGGLTSNIASLVSLGFLQGSAALTKAGIVDATINFNRTFALYAGQNDNLLELTGAVDILDGAYLNEGAVSVSIKDSELNEVAGSPITLNYISASNGDYRGILDKAANLIAGDTYIVTTTFTALGIDGEWIHEQAAVNRTS